MSILICEDNTLAKRTLSVIIEKAGYLTETTEDGIEAMHLLQEKDYELIIVDIHLPYHSGLELVRFLRSTLKKNTPVLIVTAFNNAQLQQQAAELGISGYIIKPFNPSDLVEQIRSILGN